MVIIVTDQHHYVVVILQASRILVAPKHEGASRPRAEGNRMPCIPNACDITSAILYTNLITTNS